MVGFVRSNGQIRRICASKWKREGAGERRWSENVDVLTQVYYDNREEALRELWHGCSDALLSNDVVVAGSEQAVVKQQLEPVERFYERALTFLRDEAAWLAAALPKQMTLVSIMTVVCIPPR